MREWKKYFNPITKEIMGYPVWINLDALPIEVWRKKIINKIGNAIRDFQGLDEYTQENVEVLHDLGKAKIIVWMKTFDYYPKSITLSSRWRSHIQSI